ncbi:MAG: AsmA family protein [Phycisphaerae bacterium]|nr:AsmA family protein [Phycisphaerae bacterium]
MAKAPANSVSASRPPKRRLWQHGVRAAVLGLLVAGVAYVTLPWWLPTDALRGRLVDDMSRQTGCDVTIGSLSVSWGGGVDIRDLVIHNPAGFEPEPLLRVSRLRADFSPLSFLASDTIEFVEIEDPHLRVQFDEAGRANVAVLTRMDGSTTLRRVSIRQAVVDVQLPRTSHTMRVDVGDVQLLAGRQRRPAHVTMSAAIQQASAPAPVSFRLWTESAATAASASLNFSNIQLDHLPLADMLGLPLATLAGACSGQLNLQVSDRGVVKQFDLNLLVRQLNVDGNVEADHFDLPTLEEARLSVSASLDPLGSTTDLNRVEIRVPGLELAGQASLRAHWHGGEDGKTPFLIQQIDVQGRCDPSAMAELFPGWSADAGEVEVQGPVDVAFRAARRDQSLRLDLTLDATAMAIRRGLHVFKPADRRLRYEFAGGLDDRGWQFIADRSALLLGDNRFEGNGSVRDLVRLLDTYRQPHDVTLGGLLADARNVTWNGSCRISDLRSLADAAPSLEPLLRDIRLKGALNGTFDLDHHDRSQLALRLTVPADTELTVGTLVKPPGREAAVALHGTLDPHTLTLHDVQCEARLGQAYLRAQKTRLRLGDAPRDAGVPPAADRSTGILPASRMGVSPMQSQPVDETLAPQPAQHGRDARETHGQDARATDTPQLDVDAAGEFVVMRIEDLLLVLPEADRPALRGSLHGTFTVQTDGVQFRANVHADATRTDIDASPFFAKPGGDETTADVDIYYTTDPARPRRAELALNVTLPLGNVHVQAHRRPNGAAMEHLASGQATIRDASLLADTIPLIEPTLGGATIAGKATVDFDVRQAEENTATVTRFTLAANADALAITPGDDALPTDAPPFTLASRHKAAGVPLSFHAEGLLLSHDEQLRLELSTFDARVDESHVHATMHTELSRRNDRAGEGTSVSGNMVFAPTESLCHLLPELAPVVNQYGLSGAVRLEGRFDYLAPDWTAYVVQASVHADDLGFRDVAGLTKPAGVPLSAEVNASAAKNLGEIFTVVVKASVSGTDIAASAAFTNANDTANAYGVHWPILPQLSTAHANVACKDVAALARLAPALEPYHLRGGATVDVEFAGGDTPAVRVFQLHADSLTGTLGGKAWRVHGDLRVEGLQMHEPVGLHAGRVVARELELALGENHLWLLADVQSLPISPRGEVQILARHLDDMDIANWIASLQNDPQKKSPDGDGHHNSDNNHIDHNVIKPHPEETAVEVMAYLRQALTDADLRISLSADTLRTLDAGVGQTYDVRMFHFETDVRQGHARAGYRGGLNGGLVSTHYEVNLNDPAAAIVQEVDLRELKSDETVQPQMALFFPGNTVNGTFTRQGRLIAPMRDFLAAAIDSRYPLRWTGQVRTVTTDGIVEGQSAPKFVTRVFPGLNLTRYHYNTMTGFAEFLPDGSARNDMLFSGSYDVYMEGVTGPDNWGEYEIGLCLAPVSAQWNHDWKQGRIPILKFRGRIEGGKIHDQVVSYLWPDELIFKMFLERNVVYRAWVMRQK